MKKKKDHGLDDAIASEYHYQETLLRAIRRISEEAGNVVKNEMDDAFRTANTSLAGIEILLRKRGSVRDRIRKSEKYIEFLKNARTNLTDTIDPFEAGTLQESIDCAGASLDNLKNIVDGYRCTISAEDSR